MYPQKTCCTYKVVGFNLLVLGPVQVEVGDPRQVGQPACTYNFSFQFDHVYMTGVVTRHILPHLPGVPHLHVNRPSAQFTRLYRIVFASSICSGTKTISDRAIAVLPTRQPSSCVRKCASRNRHHGSRQKSILITFYFFFFFFFLSLSG